jgi:hypothetical protein
MRPSFRSRPCDFWGHSSTGRAPPLQGGGSGFKSPWLHRQNRRSHAPGPPGADRTDIHSPPAMHESAGHRSPAGSRQGNKWLTLMLVEAASSVSRTKDTYLGAQYARIAARRDKKLAAVAVAHSMLVSAYHMLQRDEPYNDLGVTWHEQRHRDAHRTPGRPTATPRPHRHPRPPRVTTSEKGPSKHQRVRAPARTLSPAHAGVIHGSVNLAEDHLRRADWEWVCRPATPISLVRQGKKRADSCRTLRRSWTTAGNLVTDALNRGVKTGGVPRRLPHSAVRSTGSTVAWCICRPPRQWAAGRRVGAHSTRDQHYCRQPERRGQGDPARQDTSR